MSGQPATPTLTLPLEGGGEEDQARANLYALLGRLFYASPDAELLRCIAESTPTEQAEGTLATAWRVLAEASAQANPSELRDEYEIVFIGTGRAEVSLYTTKYTKRASASTPLVEVRQYLALHGLARFESAGEPEDHIAGLCEVMRYLIADEHAPLEEQQRFFARFLQDAGYSLCDAVDQSVNTRYYKHVSRLARALWDVERAAFEMLE